MNSTIPIRSRAAEENGFQIPLWGVPLVLFLLYVCLFSGLGALGLVGPDEPRYAAIARAMSETHDWVTPRLWGTPWFEKPVLYYWTAGIVMRLIGVSEFAARLPSALAALLAVVAVAWTALRSYGLGAAWYSLLMLPTSVGMIGFSRAAGPDMLFAGLLTATMAVAVEILQKPRPGPMLRIAFGFFLGAAVLAKGPAAVILAGGATLLWAALARQWRAPFRFLHPLIIAIFCATALPWYVLCALRNPDFIRVFIWQHNFERYLTPVFQHPQPFWFFGYIVALAVLPWILILSAGLFLALMHLKKRAATDSLDLFFACWALFPILFFSISQSKLPGYILPAVPPLFLLLGHWVSQAMTMSTRTLLRLLGWTGAVLLLTAIPLGAVVIVDDHDLFPPGTVLAPSLFFLFGILIVVFAMKSRPKVALLLVALLVVPAIEIANFVILPRMDIQVSARQVAGDLLKADPSGTNVAVYELPRAWQYGVDFYLNRELPEWIPGRSEPEWILAGPLPDIQIAMRYKEVLDETRRGLPLDLSLYHKK